MWSACEPPVMTQEAIGAWAGGSCHSEDKRLELMTVSTGDMTMLLASAGEAEPDERKWFARQARQKQAQKLYRRAV